MCRLLGYLGQPVALETYLIHPQHSLVAQSYQPKEMTAGLINADGFGLGWYGTSPEQSPYCYRNTLPIWNDPNVADLSRYITAGTFLAYIRSATIGQGLQLSNCQPFRDRKLLGIHNGFIENFRQTLYRPMRDSLGDDRYQAIEGTTDSEHILALIFEALAQNLQLTLVEAIAQTLNRIKGWATSYNIRVSLNVILSDGQSMIASRFAYPDPPPSLYWLDVSWPETGVLVVSEPLDADKQMRSQFGGHWQSIPANSLLTVDTKQTVEIHAL
ncbi:ergothioneine biosynthesis protein EgtC [Acaryochloris sp. IP29b_bin.137]|uniref:ergothioneine biosynthesis protein EgtC n=1 Tax=Acaryochloris sp. IP29b_bin.137 TaxID=2969217 RepID=UPI00262CFE66|nr:ergothioneine biosynthesis protein EgtC [Acaryochloris sp. IP29b_bin.137]